MLKLRLFNVNWRGTAVNYSARFAEVLGEGLPLPSDELEAGARLGRQAAVEGSAVARSDPPARPGVSGYRCYECQVRGHAARQCPSTKEPPRRTGETCKKCGVIGHYARDRPTSARRVIDNRECQPIIRPSNEGANRLNKEPRYKFNTKIASADDRLNRRQLRRRELAKAKRGGEKVTEGNPLVESTRVERLDVRYAYECTGVLRAVPTRPNTIPVPPGCGTRLMRESRSTHEEAADSAEPPQKAGAQPEVESSRDEVEETRQVEKKRSEGISVMEEASGSGEAPQKTGVQADLEPAREQMEEKQNAEHEPCERDREGAERPAYPTDEGVKTPWWREAGETAESDSCGVLCSVGATVGLRIDAFGSKCEAFLDTEKVDRLQLKARRPSEECMLTEVTGVQMCSDRVVMRSTAWGG
ncbi:hypothetical protein, conserved [Eimeria praecox]|uniref:CCHC-type domain-containing protein n=1 Tax=Eimeria praecox TaxID=51316 RepID=U6G568_9EIME|nr:hypothetical protein, conserved [Eimeria praecox]